MSVMTVDVFVAENVVLICIQTKVTEFSAEHFLFTDADSVWCLQCCFLHTVKAY